MSENLNSYFKDVFSTQLELYSGMLKNNPQELLYIKRLLIALEILYNWVISNKSLYIFDIQAIVYFSMGSKLPVILYCL